MIKKGQSLSDATDGWPAARSGETSISAGCIGVVLLLMALSMSAPLAAAPVRDGDLLVADAERCVEHFLDHFGEPIQSATLAFELTSLRTHSEPEIELHLRQCDGYEEMGSEERNRLRRVVQEQMSQPMESRVLLHYQSPDQYRLQTTGSVVSLGTHGELDSRNVSIESTSQLTIQGDTGTWRVFDGTRVAARQAERLPLWRAWDTPQQSAREVIENFFLGSQVFVERMETLSHFVPVAHDGDDVVVAAQVPGAPQAQIFLGFRPRPRAPGDLDWLLSVSPGAQGTAERVQLENWADTDGVRRPGRVTVSIWRDMPISDPPNLSQIAAAPPAMRISVVALRMEFNSEIDPNLFRYDPPPDYTVYQENPGGEPTLLQRIGGTGPPSRPAALDLPGPGNQPRSRAAPRPSLLAMALGIFLLAGAAAVAALSRRDGGAR